MPKPSLTPNGNLHSPCIDRCCLDENDICLGCNRSLAEILAWSKSTQSEREHILAKCLVRQEQRHQ
ncbi:MAG: DUF1289 domain-containing protein [Arenimonas sp.]|nr:DUF1289 domain-containing protein [Arenimonas sp.]